MTVQIIMQGELMKNFLSGVVCTFLSQTKRHNSFFLNYGPHVCREKTSLCEEMLVLSLELGSLDEVSESTYIHTATAKISLTYFFIYEIVKIVNNKKVIRPCRKLEKQIEMKVGTIRKGIELTNCRHERNGKIWKI
jgi:hypothetical protein